MNQLPLVIEIVGPAGVGKTTLCRALAQQNPTVQTGIRLRQLRYLPLFVRKSLRTVPFWLHQPGAERWLTAHELRVMVYLQVLQQLVGCATWAQPTTVLLDQGPVYKLAELRGFDFSVQPAPRFMAWWEWMVQQWATTLHLIVQLDAPDQVLLARIHERTKWHRVKAAPASAAQQLLEHGRTAFAQTIAQLTANAGPQVLHFNTSQEPLPQIVEQVLGAVENPTLWQR